MRFFGLRPLYDGFRHCVTHNPCYVHLSTTYISYVIYCSFSLFCCEEKRENEPKEKNPQKISALPAASL